ncbi:hypothetical protein RHSP_82255 (plasmid) [Rhizobium freirei PRF 81]|uniref:Transmembrane protein n=1 Tax=Rhizobium freirei PRF 81 TaxID=363754 RepID=N6UPS6_9HYPH|nr:hypothetical protein RHSP_82255 [Rhizobium freirei PRF 81]
MAPASKAGMKVVVHPVTGSGIHARLERSHRQARLSDKQWRKVFEILGAKSDANAPSASPNRRPRPVRTATLMPRFRPRRQYFFWRIERLVFGFAIVAVVAAFQMFEGTGTSQKQRGPAPAAIGSTMTPQFTATDGDTVHVSGETHPGPRTEMTLQLPTT